MVVKLFVYLLLFYLNWRSLGLFLWWFLCPQTQSKKPKSTFLQNTWFGKSFLAEVSLQISWLFYSSFWALGAKCHPFESYLRKFQVFKDARKKVSILEHDIAHWISFPKFSSFIKYKGYRSLKRSSLRCSAAWKISFDPFEILLASRVGSILKKVAYHPHAKDIAVGTH